MEPSLRLVYFDQRGSGRSERPWTGEYGKSTLVEDIEGLRRELGVRQIALIGHSFGGTLALEYAAAYPEHVSAVVFVAGLWDASLQLRYRCQRVRALYRDAPALGHFPYLDEPERFARDVAAFLTSQRNGPAER